MCKILVVDDNKTVRKRMESILKKLFPEHQITGFAATKKALKVAKEAPYCPEIVFFNSLKKNSTDGVEFAKLFRNKAPSTILIYLSPNNGKQIGIFKKLSSVGIDGYISTPIQETMVEFSVLNGLTRLKSLQSYKSEEHVALETAVGKFANRILKATDHLVPKEKKRFLGLKLK